MLVDFIQSFIRGKFVIKSFLNFPLLLKRVLHYQRNIWTFGLTAGLVCDTLQAYITVVDYFQRGPKRIFRRDKNGTVTIEGCLINFSRER